MADRYWVGGTASWDATAGTKWATTSGGAGGASVPTSVDNVFFDAASGAVTVTVSATADCADLTFTGFTGTFAGTSALNVYGSLTLSTGMTRTYSGALSMLATTSKTITSNGKTLGPITFAGIGGTWVLQDAFSSGVITHNSGTLDTNDVSVQCSYYSTLSGSGQTLLLKSSTFTCTALPQAWYMNTGGSTTVNAGTSTIRLTGNGTIFGGGNKTYNNLSIGGSVGITTLRITGSNTFNTISTTKTQAHTIRFTAGTTTTVANWTVSGTSGNVVTLDSTVAGSQFTLVKTGGGTITVDYADIKDSAASPASTWYATNSTDSGNNTNWTFGAPPSSSAFFTFFY